MRTETGPISSVHHHHEEMKVLPVTGLNDIHSNEVAGTVHGYRLNIVLEGHLPSDKALLPRHFFYLLYRLPQTVR